MKKKEEEARPVLNILECFLEFNSLLGIKYVDDMRIQKSKWNNLNKINSLKYNNKQILIYIKLNHF